MAETLRNKLKRCEKDLAERKLTLEGVLKQIDPTSYSPFLNIRQNLIGADIIILEGLVRRTRREIARRRRWKKRSAEAARAKAVAVGT